MFYHILFAFALLARIGDITTTWLVTPTLKLEANPLARKFRWPFAFLTLTAAFLAYYVPEACVAITTASLLVSASNAMKIATARVIGEDALFRMVIEHAAADRFWPGLLARIAPAFFYALLALFIFLFSPTPTSWTYWIAVGVSGYVIVWVLYSTKAYLRFRKLGLELRKN